MEEAAEGGRVAAGTVVVEAGLGVELAGGEGEAIADGGLREGVAGSIGDLELAIDIVGIALEDSAGGVGQRSNGAEAVEVIVGGSAAPLDADRLIDAGAVGVLAGDGGAGVGFGDEERQAYLPKGRPASLETATFSPA